MKIMWMSKDLLVVVYARNVKSSRVLIDSGWGFNSGNLDTNPTFFR